MIVHVYGSQSPNWEHPPWHDSHEIKQNVLIVLILPSCLGDTLGFRESSDFLNSVFLGFQSIHRNPSFQSTNFLASASSFL